MPRLPESGEFRVLDPGAGSGMLSAALVARVLAERPALSVHVVAVERDDAVVPYLRETLQACKLASDGRATFELIETTSSWRRPGWTQTRAWLGADLVIQNPPYAKLAASSAHRTTMRMAGVDAPNLYAAFLALGASALRPRGQLTRLRPGRSATVRTSGPFRSYLLDHIALDRVHVFESRSTVFAETGVLQENVIFSGTRDGVQGPVILSVSNGHEDDVKHRSVAYETSSIRMTRTGLSG